MKIGILTNEYPPNVYGGAGVHVEYLTRELSSLDGGKHSVKVFCFGKQKSDRKNLRVRGISSAYDFQARDPRHEKFLETMFKDIVISGHLDGVDVVHCHTWYSHFAGLLAKQLLQVPLILTTHSLEPHRPWKVEQLGAAYHASSWIEKTAYENADGVVAVSESMKRDVHALYGVPLDRIRVIHNGIDVRQYKPVRDVRLLDRFGIDPAVPFVLFVGRITRQKGIIHLVNALKHLRPGVQVVLCAGAPDTKAIGVEMKAAVEKARRGMKNKIIWVSEIATKEEIIALYAQAALFVCPSVYEPFGIINLEAMACETPVVASRVGGIPEVVVPGSTGTLVSFRPKGEGNVEPADPEKFARDLAAAMNRLLSSPADLKRMGVLARKRVVDHFSWTRIARQTLDFYRDIKRRS